VDPEKQASRCERKAGKNDPCPTGSACVDGRCEPLLCSPLELCGDHIDNDCDGKFDEQNPPETEACGDREDDDCDGKIDEQPDPNNPEVCGNGRDDDCDGQQDEGHDQDGDKKPWCGDATMTGGGGTADCDDYDSTVAPGLPELCDGRDNDCDSRVDESDTGSLCSVGEECVQQRCVVPDCTVQGSSKKCRDGLTCDPSTKQCVATTGCTQGSCPNGTYCDSPSGECRAQKRRNGEVCLLDGDCASGSCLDFAALKISAEGSRICGSACCSDSDCGADERCFVPGTGARSCLPVSLAPPPFGSLQQCLDDGQCGGGQSCAVIGGQPLAAPVSSTRNDLIAPACRQPPRGTLQVGDMCLNESSCESDVCVPGAGLFVTNNVCSRVCGTTKDCDELTASGSILTGLVGTYCRFVEREPTRDIVPVCVVNRGELGHGAFGSQCSSGTDCLEGSCLGASGEGQGFCTMACCRNTDCPRLGGAPTLCRPVAFGASYEMRCVP
jgi:hypothetical protein